MSLSPSFQFHPSSIFDSLHCFSRLQFHHRLHLLRYKSTKNLNCHSNPISNQNPDVKIQSLAQPTKNWIESWPQSRHKPLQKPSKSVVDYRNSTTSDDEEVVGTSRSTGSSTMVRIVEKLKKFGYVDDSGGRKERPLPEKGSVEDIFYAEDGVLPNSRGGLSMDLNEDVRFPWEKPSLEVKEGGERRKRSKTTVAELTLPEGELRRLRHLAIRTKSKTKIKGAGVTKEIVDLIHEKWMTEEVVRLKCEGPSALNMRRMHEILERKTGGLVIWRSGSSISLYRGVSYETPEPVKKPYHSIQTSQVGSFSNVTYGSPMEISRHTMQYPCKGLPGVSTEMSRRTTQYPREGVSTEMSRHTTQYPREGVSTEMNRHTTQYPREGLPAPGEKEECTESPPEIKYESEVDNLLDSLGPRYTDWPGSDPLPVDADMLPGIVPGYKPPFRVLPYGVRASLGYKEGTALRRLARVLPPHFALGRSRQHQGLAAAMLKLWERSSIAKIALKRGVQLTTSERMAEDIKKLTGGAILSRNKDYIVFYRGKDFLSPEVTEALLERERLAKTLQDEEEKARVRASSLIVSNVEKVEEPGIAGTLGETLEADARWGNKQDEDHMSKMLRAAEEARHAVLVRKLERKLYIAERKLSKGERVLAKIEEVLKPVERTADPESITDEERFMFRKLGLRMKAFLLLGRRGVFDGTVENMHLHWKYRELVKVIVKAKSFAQVKNVALALEAESGGILVSVDKISKGFAVIVYRGKDYQRPTLRPKNLLTKRKALARSIELQRHEALQRHVSNLHKRVETLRSELCQMEDVKEQGDEDLYSKLDSAYSTEDEDTEDEGDEAYLETFDSAVDFDDDGDDKDAEYDINDDDDDDRDDCEDGMINNLLPAINSCYNEPDPEEAISNTSKECI